VNSLKIGVLITIISNLVLADGFVIFPPPYLTPLSVKYHKVECSINDGIATTTVDQEFVNNLDYSVTGGRYVFPVPVGAVIDQFKVMVNGELKTATVMSKDSARSFFIDAVKKSNQATLLEYTGNNAYTLEIGSLEPGSSRRIQISYIEVLDKIDGLSRYLYPLNTEKFSRQLIDTVSINVKISNSSPVTSVYSPSFAVGIERLSDKQVSVSYSSTLSRPDRDFELFYKLSDDAISLHLFPFKKVGEDGYFLMLITPKFVQPESENEKNAKDILFTIDRSGSMAGTKIAQARDALRFCINRLLPEDFFNIVAFDNTISSNATELLPATSANISQALAFVQSVTDQGSTDIEKALRTSLQRMVSNNDPHYCIFLTDGQPTSGVTDIATISTLVNEANNSNTRIFSVGFGFDVNTVLIDKISMDNGGYPLYCSPDQSIEQVISELYQRIESPVMTSPVLSIPPVITTWDILPQRLPDLFNGSQLVLCGRYRGAGRSTVSLSGVVGNKFDTLSYSTDFPDSSIDYSFVPRLWATQKIASLMAEIKIQKLTGDNLQQLVDSVTSLSLEFGIVTPYTSALFVNNGSSSAWVGGLQQGSGKSANESSNYMQGMMQNTNADQTMIADTSTISYLIAPKANQMQNVNNKLFLYTSQNVWRDVTLDTTASLDTIYYGSEEYFALAIQNQDLLELLTVGNQAAFNYAGKNYLILDQRSTATKPMTSSNNKTAGISRLSVVQSANQVCFHLNSAKIGNRLELFTVDGRNIAKLLFNNSGKAIFEKSGKLAIPSGIVIAVFNRNGKKIVSKFSVW
jgi:Ca-activated chloride channel family protein